MDPETLGERTEGGAGAEFPGEERVLARFEGRVDISSEVFDWSRGSCGDGCDVALERTTFSRLASFASKASNFSSLFLVQR